MHDPKLLGSAFAKGDWTAWESFLCALFGLSMTDAQRAIYAASTGRTDTPTTQAREAWVPTGRRAGKSRIAALVCVYLATCRDYSDVLAKGEVGTIAVVCPDRKQARTILRYVRGFLDASPYLKGQVVSDTKEGIELKNRTMIEVHTSSFKSVRGYSVLAAILDECAFLKSDDSATPDVELVRALEPAMALIPHALLIGISSPYGKHGILWERYRDHYGKPGDVLVWQAPTRRQNPSCPQRVIDEALARDEAAARAEDLAEFRTDVERLYAPEVLDSATDYDRPLELPPLYGVTYYAFCDLSAGSTDSAALAIAHDEDGVVVLDLTREVLAPFAADDVVAQFTDVLAQYGVTQVWGDRFAGTWGREPFEAQGFEYIVSGSADDPAKLGSKSDIFGSCLPLFTSRRVRLPHDTRLKAQFAGLERKTSRVGKDSIAKRIGASDDVCNAAAGALCLAAQPSGGQVHASNLARDATRVAIAVGHDVPMTYERELLERDRFTSRHDAEFGMPGRLIA